MNKTLNINVFYNNSGNTILEILEQDFKEFFNDYIKKYIKQLNTDSFWLNLFYKFFNGQLYNLAI